MLYNWFEIIKCCTIGLHEGDQDSQAIASDFADYVRRRGVELI